MVINNALHITVVYDKHLICKKSIFIGNSHLFINSVACLLGNYRIEITLLISEGFPDYMDN